MPLPVAAALGAAGIGAAGQLGGGLIGGLMNQNQAGISRDDQRYYTEHAHQVEVADLKAAGLNPILSANSGASVPTPVTSSPGDNVAAGVSSSAQTLGNIPRMINDLAEGAARVENIKADTEKKKADTGAVPSQVKLAESQSERNAAEAELAKRNAGVIPYRIQEMIANMGATGALAALYGKDAALRVAQTDAVRAGIVNTNWDSALKAQAHDFNVSNNPVQLMLNRLRERVMNAEIISMGSSARAHDAAAGVSDESARKLRLDMDVTRLRGGYEGWRGDAHNFGERLGQSFINSVKALTENPSHPSYGQNSAAGGIR